MQPRRCGHRRPRAAAAAAVAEKPPRRAAGNGGCFDATGADLEFWCRTELEMLCRCPDVLLLWFSRRISGTTSADCAGLTGSENLARIFVANHSAVERTISNSSGKIRPRCQSLRGLSMSHILSGLASVTATCVLLELRLQPRSFDSRYSGSHTKPSRVARGNFAQDLSAQSLQEFAASWALNVLHAPCSTQEGPSREHPSISVPHESLLIKLAGHGPQATPKRWRGCLTRSLLYCGRGECLRNRRPKRPWAVFERILRTQERANKISHISS
jgi:hypothetical protein